MAIKRGISSYSYQQEMFFHRMNWKDMIKEVHDNLKTDGIEIIDEMIIRDYPYPSERFYDEWKEEMDKYNMKAVTMDVFLDVHQFRDHVMSHEEAAERLKRDIVIASNMGFENIRCLCLVPIDVIEMALPTAEKYNVRIGKEIHAPLSIKYGASAAMEEDLILDPRSVDQIIDLARKTGSRHVGLVPDMGVFQHSPTKSSIAYQRRNAKNPDVIDFILECRGKMGEDEILERVKQKYPDSGYTNKRAVHGLAMTEMCSQPEDLVDIIPYILSIHGKFYGMEEIQGCPGHYEDPSINYADPIRVLKEHGFDGYINSEYEGQRDKQDLGMDQMANEIEEVRRHHNMLRDLIGE
ncbi:MAG: hypothetical protein ACI4TF_10155 [Oliverpabstia sp.]